LYAFGNPEVNAIEESIKAYPVVASEAQVPFLIDSVSDDIEGPWSKGA
jgi:hypothetical protein